MRAMGFKKKVGRGPRVPDKPKKPTIHDCERFFTGMIKAEKSARWDVFIERGTPDEAEVSPDGYYYLIGNRLDEDGECVTMDATDVVRSETISEGSQDEMRDSILYLGQLCAHKRPRAAMYQMMGTAHHPEKGPVEVLISFMCMFDEEGGVEKVMYDHTEVLRHDSLKSKFFPGFGRFMGWGKSVEVYQWTADSEEEITTWVPEALSWKDSA